MKYSEIFVHEQSWICATNFFIILQKIGKQNKIKNDLNYLINPVSKIHP
jgi:hypothetical protein